MNVRASAAIALLVLAAASAQARDIPVPQTPAWRDVAVDAKPWRIRGDADPGETLEVGALIYRGGVALSSPDPAFGGFSGLIVSDDGASLLAVSDRSQWLEATIEYDANGRIAGLSKARMAALVDADGKVISGDAADSEGLSAGAGGRVLVSFERAPRIDAYVADASGMWRFDARIADFAEDAPPFNSGVEAIAVTDAGLLAVAEAPFASGAAGYLIGAETNIAIAYEPEGEYAVTDFARLGDELFVLERAFSKLKGVRARLSRASVPDAEHPMLEPEVLARLRPPYVIDNMEGLGVRRGEDGGTLFYVLSDDNHADRQNTILLLFERPAAD